jgi:hypothetical protein
LEKTPSPEALIYEARARILWGEPIAEVCAWLQERGVDQQRIDDVIRVSLAERAAVVRKRAIMETVIGGGIVLGTAALMAAYIQFTANSGGRKSGFGIIVAVGFYGLYRLCRGIMWLISGAGVRGSLTELGGELDR